MGMRGISFELILSGASDLLVVKMINSSNCFTERMKPTEQHVDQDRHASMYNVSLVIWKNRSRCLDGSTANNGFLTFRVYLPTSFPPVGLNLERASCS